MAKIVDIKRSTFHGVTLELNAKEFDFLYRLLGNHVTGGSSYTIFSAMADVAETYGVECEDLPTMENNYIRIKDEK